MTVFNFGPDNHPFDIAISPDGAFAYVTIASGNTGSLQNTVVKYDIALNKLVGTPIPVQMPFNIDITPDGTKAYVSNMSMNRVTPIDLLTNTPGAPIPVGSFAQGIAITANGQIATAVNAGSLNVTPIHIPGNNTEPPIPVGSSPFDIAITPDSKKAYVTNYTGVSVTPINLITFTAEAFIPVSWPTVTGIAITPDQAPTASFIVETGSVGSPTEFDASSSFSPVGAIATYAWDFGDGTMEVVSTPKVSHTYLSAGNFIVTLIVTNTAGTSTQQTFTGHTVSNNGGPSAVTTQQISIIDLQPPSQFKGVIIKNKLLNSTIPILEATWKASPTLNVAAYRIYKNRKLIAVIPATSPLKFVTRANHNFLNTFEIAAVNRSGAESQRIPLIL